MTSDGNYSSNLGNKASLLGETKQVFTQYVNSGSVDYVRDLVLEDNLLLKNTMSNRKRVWETIFTRYFSGRDEEAIMRLARLVNSPLPEQAKHLILFHELAKATPLVYDLTVGALYDMYHAGRSSVTKADILQWLEGAEEAGHDEIGGWSPQTRGKVASNYLTIVRDFGLLEGKQRKTFTTLYVPLPAFVYVLYRLKDEGQNATSIMESPDFRLFLMEQRDVVLLLEEAARASFVTFQQAGDIVDLRFHYENTAEAVDELIRQV